MENIFRQDFHRGLSKNCNLAEVKGEGAVKYNIGIEFIKIPEEELKILTHILRLPHRNKRVAASA